MSRSPCSLLALLPLPPVLALAVLVAACGSDAGSGPAPTKLADPRATAARIQGLDAPFTTPPFRSFAFAGAYSPAASAVGALGALGSLLQAAGPAWAGRPPRSPGETRRLAAAVRAAVAPWSGAARAATLPPELLGKTYEWNATTFQYAVTERAGAPVNAVRFILYALDVGGVPIVTQEIGYADLQDERIGSTNTLHILLVGTTTGPPVTFLDYRVSVTTTINSSSATVVGFVTDGVRRLDFSAALTGDANRVTIDIRFDVNAEETHVRLTLTITAPDANTLALDVDFRLQFASEVVTVTGTDTDSSAGESGTLTVRVNGGLYATITIANGAPTYTGGGGQALTGDDQTALDALGGAIGGMVDHLDAMLAPANALAP